jgi:homogentisate 1,2-dioxygenase
VRAESVERALSKDQGPHRFGNHALWFQFETALPFSLSPWVKQSAQWLADWPETWGAYRTHFRKEA